MTEFLLFSCVHTIEETLSSLRPAPTSIHVSVVSQSVTVAHSKELSPLLIKNEIEDAGFDIATTPLAGPSRLPDSSFSSSLLSGRRQKHVDQCYMCRNDLEGKHSHGGSQDSLASSSPEKRSEPQHIAIPTTTEESQPFHLTLSVGGMTCAVSSSILQTISIRIGFYLSCRKYTHYPSIIFSRAVLRSLRLCPNFLAFPTFRSLYCLTLRRLLCRTGTFLAL